MAYPNKASTLAKLAEWQAHHDAVEKLMDGIKASIGLDPAGPLYDTVWGLFGGYTESISAEIGDLGNWLCWFQFENEMGKRGHEAGYDGKTRKVKTLEHLCGLVFESRGRA
jgi:hypothetical protein